MEIKRFITKYLLIVIGLAILRVLINEILPDLFTQTIIGDEFTQTKTTLFGMYQTNFFNLILGLIIALDLHKIGRNWVVIPILTVISATAGLFFFSILILNNLINKYEQI